MFFGNFIFDKNKNFVIVKLTQYMHVVTLKMMLKVRNYSLLQNMEGKK